MIDLHPKQICADVQSMGSKLVLDGEDLYIENPMNVCPEVEQFIKSYKSRIVTYLKGGYSDKDHNVIQTIDKIILFMNGEDLSNSKIQDWLNNDDQSMTIVLELIVMLSKNGWTDCKEPIANYETVETYKLSKEIYERAMSYFKRGS